MRTLAFLEHFVATRRQVKDLSVDPQVGGGCSDLPGYVYADRFFIEIEPDGTLYMPIANEEARAKPEDLCVLEGLLFEYAQKEGLDAEECHAVCVARHLACPTVCPVCGGAS